MRDLAERVAVVTGAASGIGLALARALGSEGMRIVLSDIETGPLEEARSGLAEAGVECIACRTDVSDAASVRTLADRTLEAFGAVHLICNNAGVVTAGASWEVPLSDFRWVLGVNLWGVLHGVHTFLPILLDQGEPGHVVNVASMAGLTASPGLAAYQMSKHAVVSLSEGLYQDLALRDADVGVSLVCPEMIATNAGHADRNRPAHLSRAEGSDPGGTTRRLEKALQGGLTRGIPPEEIARRTLAAIREKRFYVLPPEEHPSRHAVARRLDDILHARNPRPRPPGI